MQFQNQNQGQNQYFQNSTNMPPQMNHGGHEIFDAHEAVGGLVGALEQSLFYEQHIQDPELKSILQRHKSFKSQMYNTIIETLKSGQDPAVKTQVYEMNENNDVVYGTKPTQPKAPAQSVNEINDQCISGFMMGGLKSCATAFTDAALESTNPVLRRIFADSIPNIIEMAYELFLYSNKKQYYQVPQLTQQDTQNYVNGFAPIQGGTMMH